MRRCSVESLTPGVKPCCQASRPKHETLACGNLARHQWLSRKNVFNFIYLTCPGLIDGHTHPVWAGDRVHEFAMKLAGATYMEVHAAGGGIHFTVEKTRMASEMELVDLLVDRLRRMLRAGTTTVECKVLKKVSSRVFVIQIF